MLDFRTPSEQTNPPASLWPKLAPLVGMLLVAGGMLIYMARTAKQPENPPAPPPSPVAAPEPRTRSDQLVIAVDHERIADFADHARQKDIDWDAFFYLLNLARNNPPARLRELARSDITFGMLLDDPNRYRGEILRIRGRLRRLIQYTAAANDQGIATQYEGWLFTPDSGDLPYTLIFADPPADIPTATSMHVNCEVVGYFLGWWRFDTAERKPSSAPFIMVSSVRRLDLPVGGGDSPPVSTTTLVLTVAAAVAVTLAAVAWYLLRWERGNASAVPAVDADSLTFDSTPQSDNQPDPETSHSNGEPD